MPTAPKQKKRGSKTHDRNTTKMIRKKHILFEFTLHKTDPRKNFLNNSGALNDNIDPNIGNPFFCDVFDKNTIRTHVRSVDHLWDKKTDHF